MTSRGKRVWEPAAKPPLPYAGDALLEAVDHTEVAKLAAAERELSAKLPPVEALRAWTSLFVDYIAEKHIIAPALNAFAGGPSKLYD